MIAGIVAQQMMIGGGGGPLPPSANLILNPNAEDGTNHWVSEIGANFTTRIGDIVSGLPNFFFGTYSIANRTLREIQTFNVPPEFQAYSGGVKLNVSFDYRNGELDFAILSLRCYSEENAGGEVTGILWGDNIYSETAINYATELVLPKGTKSVTFALLCRQLDGAGADVYFRNVQAVISTADERAFPIFSWHTPVESGWTVTAGNIAGSFDAALSGTFLLPSAFGGSQANLAYYRDIDPTPEALAAIASGNAEARLSVINWRVNSSDRSRCYIACLDASDTQLAIIEDAAVPTTWGREPNRQRHSGAIPAGTVKFRVGHQFARSDGTVNDATSAQFSATIYVPA